MTEIEAAFMALYWVVLISCGLGLLAALLRWPAETLSVLAGAVAWRMTGWSGAFLLALAAGWVGPRVLRLHRSGERPWRRPPVLAERHDPRGGGR